MTIAKYLHPWNRNLWYWEIAELRQFVDAAGVQTNNLQTEGLKYAARLLRNRPNLGHEEVNYFAEQVQQTRALHHGGKYEYMRLN